MKKLILLPLAAIALFASCKGDDDVIENDPNDYRSANITRTTSSNASVEPSSTASAIPSL